MNIPETAVETIAKFMSQEAMDWVDVETDDHEHDLECTNWRAYKDDTRTALEAALPHLEAALRKQIAADIRALKTKADLMSATDLKRNSAIDDAARVAEEGTTK